MNQSNPLFAVWGKIFEIINFQGDKKEFLERFINSVTIRTVEKLLQIVPETHRGILRDVAVHLKSPEQLVPYIKGFCTPQQLMQYMISASTDTFQSFIDGIRPNLSENQERQLFSFLESLQQQIPPQMKTLMQQVPVPQQQIPTRRA